MIILPSISALFFVAALQSSSGVDETPAQPSQPRKAPDYPVACYPPSGESVDPQTVVVTFDVTREGITENVRVRESTDECFEETAINTVRGWTYEPRRVNGRAKSQTDLETTFTFVFEKTTSTEDFDARPIYREPPKYPERCMRGAKDIETVLVQFDVTTEGIPENIEVIESTNSCFERAATKAVAEWRYRPKTLSGKPVIRQEVVTQITFELSDSLPPEFEVRRSVYYGFKSVHRLLSREKYEKALEKLTKLEEKYGDTFSQVELSTFLRLRATARIGVKDYAGALDDLRAVQQMGLGEQANEAVGKMILQLEAIIASQEAAPADSEG